MCGCVTTVGGGELLVLHSRFDLDPNALPLKNALPLFLNASPDRSKKEDLGPPVQRSTAIRLR